MNSSGSCRQDAIGANARGKYHPPVQIGMHKAGEAGGRLGVIAQPRGLVSYSLDPAASKNAASDFPGAGEVERTRGCWNHDFMERKMFTGTQGAVVASYTRSHHTCPETTLSSHCVISHDHDDSKSHIVSCCPIMTIRRKQFAKFSVSLAVTLLSCVIGSL